MIYADTHVHLNDEKLYNKIDQVIKEAHDNDVKLLFVVGWDLESSIQALEIAHTYDNIYAIIGFHPCNIKNYTDKEYNFLKEYGKDDKVAAIGEIGYDLHWDDTTKEEQTIAFEKQIQIAIELNKPISIHSREADQLTFNMIKKYKDKLIGGVLHAYSGSVELAEEYKKMNFVFGVGGVVTFKNAKTIKEVVKKIDMKYFISETDSPYLTPTPYRGEENSPKYIPLIVKEIANIKELDEDIVKQEILKNIERVFKVCV